MQLVLVVNVAQRPASKIALGYWVSIPVHIVPVVVCLALQSRAYRWYAKRQLRDAKELDELEAKRIPVEMNSTMAATM